jgi:6-bladed beta-propeller
MYRTHFLLIFIIFCLFNSCTRHAKDAPVEKGTPAYSIALKGPETINVTTFDSLFDNYRIIPLQLDSSSLVASVSKVIRCRQHFYVLDSKFSAVYCFSNEGKLLLKFGKLGIRNGYYKRLSDFDIDTAANELALLSNDDQSIYYYSLDSGVFKKQIWIGLFASQLALQPEGKVLVYINFNTNKNSGKYNVFLLDSAGKMICNYFPILTKKQNVAFPFSGFLQRSEDSTFFAEPFDDTVYVFKNDKFYSHTQIPITSLNITLTKDDHHKLYTESILMDSSASYLGSAFMRNSDFLVAAYQKNGMRFMFHNLSSNRTYSLQKGATDPLLGIIQKACYIGEDNTTIFSIPITSYLYVKEKFPALLNSLSKQTKDVLERGNLNGTTYFLMLAKIKKL